MCHGIEQAAVACLAPKAEIPLPNSVDAARLPKREVAEVINPAHVHHVHRAEPKRRPVGPADDVVGTARVVVALKSKDDVNFRVLCTRRLDVGGIGGKVGFRDTDLARGVDYMGQREMVGDADGGQSELAGAGDVVLHTCLAVGIKGVGMAVNELHGAPLSFARRGLAAHPCKGMRQALALLSTHTRIEGDAQRTEGEVAGHSHGSQHMTRVERTA